MPRGERRFTEFRFDIDGETVVVPVTSVDGPPIRFRVRESSMGLNLLFEDVNELRAETERLIRHQRRTPWERFLYIRSNGLSVEVTAYLVSTTHDGTKRYLKVPFPDLRGDPEAILALPWNGRFEHEMVRTSLPTGQIIEYGSTAQAALLPFTAESVGAVQGVRALAKEQEMTLRMAVAKLLRGAPAAGGR